VQFLGIFYCFVTQCGIEVYFLLLPPLFLSESLSIGHSWAIALDCTTVIYWLSNPSIHLSAIANNLYTMSKFMTSEIEFTAEAFPQQIYGNQRGLKYSTYLGQIKCVDMCLNMAKRYTDTKSYHKCATI